MVVFAIPATSHAMAGAQRCMNTPAFDTVGLHGFLEQDISVRQDWDGETLAQVTEDASDELAGASPCGLGLSDDADADPSFNLCFESAGEPISTLPRYIVRWRGEKEAASVVDSIFLALEESAGEREAPRNIHQVGSALVALSVETAPRRHVPVEDNLMCTTRHLEQCNAMPPVAESMRVAAPAGVPIPRHHFEHPADAPTLETRPWAHLRVGPQSGHPRLPEQPPRV
ncbi:hypothetical protein [Bradymonas sediminis]|nr:hypothetical protein [Bradymonas sediminis]